MTRDFTPASRNRSTGGHLDRLGGPFLVKLAMNPRRAEDPRGAAERGEYSPLHRWFASSPEYRCRLSFAQIEQILGLELPNVARVSPEWWSSGDGRDHALAWEAAGFNARVSPEEEAVLFTRRVDLDREWPALPGNPWPPGFTASRRQLYDDDGR